MLKTYNAIDYKTWNFNGKGSNILNSLFSTEKKIWEKALSHQDRRNDTGHAEVATYFALQLLNQIPEIKRNVVIPAIILHDIGYEISPDDFRKAFLSKNPDKELQKKIRLEHQVRGVVLASQILETVKFPTQDIGEILRIIADHDTRFYDTTNNGKIVQDVDILWRFTKPCIDAYLSDKSSEEIRKISEEKDFPLLHLSVSKEIAKTELENIMGHYK